MIYYIITFIFITFIYLLISYKKKSFLNICLIPYLYHGIIMVFLYIINLYYNKDYFCFEMGDFYLILYFILEFLLIAIVSFYMKPIKMINVKITKINKRIVYILLIIIIVYFTKNISLIKLAISNPRMFYANTRIGGGVIYFVIIPIIELLYYIYIAKINYSNKFSIFKSIIATGIIFVILYIFGQKSVLLNISIIWLFTIYYKIPDKNYANKLIIKLGLIVVVAFLCVFMLYSSQQNIEYNNVLLGISTYSDYLSNFKKLVKNLDDFSYGKLFLQDEFLGYIPRFVWQNKPTLYGSLGLGLHVPELVEWTLALTGAPSFGPLGQVYADFGIFGLFFKLIIQFFFLLAVKNYEQYLEKKFNVFNLLLYFTFSGVLIFSITLTTFPIYQLGVIVVLVFFSKGEKNEIIN